MQSNTHQMKKPAKTKPLTAYNLFFQYERMRLIKTPDIVLNGDYFSSNPGLEDVDALSPVLEASEIEIRKFRKDVIEKVIEESASLAPRKKRRVHKKTHGVMNFLEMTNHISKKWNAADDATKSIFRQISNEKREKQAKSVCASFKAISKRFSIPAGSGLLSHQSGAVAGPVEANTSEVNPLANTSDGLAIPSSVVQDTKTHGDEHLRHGEPQKSVCSSFSEIPRRHSPDAATSILSSDTPTSMTAGSSYINPFVGIDFESSTSTTFDPGYRARRAEHNQHPNPLSFVRSDEVDFGELRNWLSHLDWSKM